MVDEMCGQEIEEKTQRGLMLILAINKQIIWHIHLQLKFNELHIKRFCSHVFSGGEFYGNHLLS